MKIPLSIVILTRNEENNIERSLKSAEFADEVIIIDDNSTDDTISVAKKFPVKILTRALASNFADQRNYGLEIAQHDWVLFLDADEEITTHLQKEIHTSIQNGEKIYALRRRDFFWGRELKYGETQKARNRGIIRLVKKGGGTWKGAVHEAFETSKPVVVLESFLNHYPHQSIKEFIQDINIYSTLRAKELLHNGKKTNFFEILFFPLAKFILTYFIYRGFLDGPSGFVYSFFMSFHSFLVRAKLYQYSQFGNGK